MLLQSNVETDDDDEEFDKIIPTPRSNSLSALSSMKSEDMLKCYADPTWRLQVWYINMGISVVMFCNRDGMNYVW